MAPTSYADVIVRNIRGMRSRKGLDQSELVERMRALGFTNWHRQTISRVERGDRRIQAEELLGLAVALETTMPALLTALDDDKAVEFPSGQVVDAAYVRALATGFNDGSVKWKGNTPEFGPGKRAWFAGDPDAPEAVKAGWQEAGE